MTAFQPGAVVYTQGSGSSSLSGLYPVIQTRAPTSIDVLYSLGQTWVDTVDNTTYQLTSLHTFSGITTANWALAAGPTGDVSGPASSIVGDIAIFGNTTGNLIADSGISISSIVTVLTGTVTTIGAVTATVITVPLGATPTVFSLDMFVEGFDAATPAGVAYAITGGVRTTGSAATIIASPMVDNFEEAALTAADVTVAASGNNLQINVTGVAGKTIAWKAQVSYVKG